MIKNDPKMSKQIPRWLSPTFSFLTTRLQTVTCFSSETEAPHPLSACVSHCDKSNGDLPKIEIPSLGFQDAGCFCGDSKNKRYLLDVSDSKPLRLTLSSAEPMDTSSLGFVLNILFEFYNYIIVI